MSFTAAVSSLDTAGPTATEAPVPAVGAAVGDRRAPHRWARWGLFGDLSDPRQLISNITPNWYASIMGTGIVAVAGATLPQQFPGFRLLLTIIWAVAAVLLVALTVVTALHWRYHRSTARGHSANPVMVQFYGALPMAMLTIGAGTLLLGKDVVGLRFAVDLDWVLWFGGTVLGLVCATAVPYLMFTQHRLRPDSAFGGWLMPVVPPMVTASTGALLVPYTSPGQARLSLLLCCYAMFGMSLLASIIVITLIWYRLAVFKVGEARMVPTLWIVLGPLGQSITAANLLGGVAHEALPAPYSTALQAFGVVYGVPVWGFAVLWAGIAGAITLRTVRAGLPFSLTWWSFTFPIGTCVTGTTGLAVHTGSTLFTVAAGISYVVLVAGWMIVAVRTGHGSFRGRLFLPPAAGPSPVAGAVAPSAIRSPATSDRRPLGAENDHHRHLRSSEERLVPRSRADRSAAGKSGALPQHSPTLDAPRFGGIPLPA